MTVQGTGGGAAAAADGIPGDERGEGSGAFRVAVAPGVVVQRWVGRWVERRADTPITVVPTPETAGVGVLHAGTVDVSFVRLPVDREGLSLIPLYEEVPVVVVPHDHVLTTAEEVGVDDLAGEALLGDLTPRAAWSAVLDPVAAAGAVEQGARGGGRTDAAGSTSALTDVLALVAAGAGVVVVPQSVARLHHRKDLTYRPVTGLPPTVVGLAWLAERTTADLEEFVGIVRGRTARSSRSPAAGGPDEAAGTTPGAASGPSATKASSKGTGRRATSDGAGAAAGGAARARPRHGAGAGRRRGQRRGRR